MGEHAELRLDAWIRALKKELERAARKEREKAEEEGLEDHFSFLLKEAKLEVEVRAESTEGTKGEVKFWVVTAGVEERKVQGSTHRVSLVFAPAGADQFLGD